MGREINWPRWRLALIGGVIVLTVLLVAATMVAANLVVDLLYGALDPRLRQRTA